MTRLPDLEDRSLNAAYNCSRANKSRRAYPDENDPRYQEGLILPELRPRFKLDLATGQSIFTIGSCFARNIEIELEKLGVDLPTMAFSVPESEWQWPRRNGILNEFNPGTIAQRILNALQGRRSDEGTLVATGQGWGDLLLASRKDVTWERGIARREEVFDIYAHLPRSQAVIITLGYIEAWYDAELETYLNRMPSPQDARTSETRYRYHRLGVQSSLNLLHPAIEALTQRGIKVLISVSPVPLQTTFEDTDCVMANDYSKSVLRVVAEELWRSYPLVDYLPTYESIRTTGLPAYADDHVHVRADVVRAQIEHIISAYRA
jgi:hypothetical protein